ncbi:MAG: ABC transporter ATP-binding protein [Planctomycetota bacterium]
MSTPSILVRGLGKSFHGKAVLRGIDLEVQRGQVLGYIGANGAGKTTTVRILTGLLGDFEGTAEVAGHDVRHAPLEVKARIGYVPENAALYDALSVREFLLLVGRLHGLPDAVSLRRMEELLAAFGLAERIGSRLGSLSKGMRQKVLICSALLHDPQVIFLDEPLSGLDVASTILVKTLIRALADRGRTVFYCSHMMDVVERVCDRIVILSEGHIVADGTFEELSAARSGGSLESIFAELTGAGGEDALAQRIVSAIDDGHP